MLSAALARTFTKDELAQVLGVREALVRQWTRDGTIPAHLYIRDGDRTYKYHPLAIAVGELMKELSEFFGVNSPIPKAVTKQLIPQIERIWNDPALIEQVWRASEPLVRMTVTHGELEISAPLTFLKRTQEKLAAAAA